MNNIAKKERHNPIKVIKNVWFMVRYTLRYTPGYIWVTLGEAFGRGLWHIFGVLYLKYLFDAIERGTNFKEILIVSILMVTYNVLFELFNKWWRNVYRPKAVLVLHEGMQTELYQKAQSLDQSCYDNPEFYNDFIWAIRESDKRVTQIMGNISIIINRIFSSIVILGVLATMDWIVAIVLLVSVALGMVIKFYLNKIRYERSLELNPINRKLSYIGRIFYLPDHAKELRQGEIAELLQRQYRETIDEKIKCTDRYSWKIFRYSLLSSVFTNALPHAGVSGYLIIRYMLDSTLSLGSFSASLTASFKLYWAIDDIGNYLTKFNEHSLYVEKFRRFSFV